MIEQETGLKFTEICQKLIDEGLSPTEIQKELELKSISSISTEFYKDKLKEVDPTYIIKKKTKSGLEKEIPILTGLTYKEFLIQKHIVESLSAYEIASIIGIPYSTASYHIKSYGISKDKSKARNDAIKKGMINYTEMNQRSRKTRNKKSGSNKQEMIRDLFKYHLESEIYKRNLNQLEVVIGYNEYGILHDLEVDIPIIIIDNNKNTYYKYSIEYNGEKWHDEERDNVKSFRLIQNGWNHFIIPDDTQINNTEIKYIKPIVNQIIIKTIQT